jgi:hypothetical protein
MTKMATFWASLKNLSGHPGRQPSIVDDCLQTFFCFSSNNVLQASTLGQRYDFVNSFVSKYNNTYMYMHKK